jgi:hypothetical protein
MMLSDYGLSLKLDKKTVAEFLHYVFIEFSNTDENTKPNIIFIDLKQMFRLANIISRDGK